MVAASPLWYLMPPHTPHDITEYGVMCCGYLVLCCMQYEEHQLITHCRLYRHGAASIHNAIVT